MKIKNSLFLTFFSVALLSPSVPLAESNIDFFFNTSSPKYNKILVKKIIKADLIELESGEVIRLIGLNAPKPPEDMGERFERTEQGFVIDKIAEDPRVTIAETSFHFAEDLLLNKYVRLEFDNEKSGNQFETLAYVFLLDDNTFVNAEILRQGYAQLRIRPPNMKYAKELRHAYQEARKNLRGLQGE